ncbi:MAG TPA: NADPH:quinone oxidoreductase family protein [Rhizomicrobium sp.]|jgi:NADPH2:quinone reductase|nr:NADPH:quinone oxidoreductase family protein [Rhizomicrobium sp.]
MKAALCTHYGPPEALEIREVPSPVPGKGQVLVSVKSCGVNFPDVLLIQDKYQFKPPLPFAPGGEIAGVVKAVGEGVTTPKPGDRVIASIGTGGFAEEALAEAARSIPMPESLDFAVASCFFIAYGTSWHALKDRAQLQPGETLVVLGAAGGVGLAAVEIGHAIGARVIAGASSEEKVALARRHGADEGFVYPAGKLSKDEQKALAEDIKRTTGGKGADVLYDPVGSDYAEPALRAMNWGGRYLVIGFAAGEIPRVPLNLTLLKGSSIVGVFWGAAVARDPKKGLDDLAQITRLIAEGQLKPHISARVPLARAGDAIRLLMDRKAQGKVVVIP